MSGRRKFRARWWMYGLVSLVFAALAVWGMATDDVGRQVTGLVGAMIYAFVAGGLVVRESYEDAL